MFSIKNLSALGLDISGASAGVFTAEKNEALNKGLEITK